MSPATRIVRPYVASDVDGLLAMWTRLSAADPVVAHPSRAVWERHVDDNGGGRWFRVATVGGEIAGFLSAIAPEKGTRSIQVLIEPAHRRRGIGRALLDAAFALDHGTTTLETLCPATWAAARSFYEACGFVVVEEEIEMSTHEGSFATTEPRWPLRAATPADAERLSEIHAQAFSTELSFTPIDAAFFVRRMDAEGETLLVAELDGRVVAYCHSERDEAARQVSIEQLAVAAEGRRRGLARALLARSMGGFESASLRVDESNAPAIALYRAFGFVEKSRWSRFHGRRAREQSSAA